MELSDLFDHWANHHCPCRGQSWMIKVSEHTPKTGQWGADTLHACLPSDVCQVVQGDVSVAQAFCPLPFDHLLFTGGTALGAAVMGAAAKNFTSVTLQLGGKSPAIVGAGADIANAAGALLQANGGTLGKPV
jgi:acyl-CoA reductase-like NAD-dependent aldehyde dehydrogenase